MALRLRKDIKKSSYYVWFLGAKESKGLRGSEYIIPVIRHLEEREKDVEPFKVTLQVSHKGLKIVQNIVSQGPKSSKPKNETIKHFIPHNTITYVYQHEDIISCILLLFNPVTKCPLHVHAYRCDSLETASHLKQQLQILIDRPENQKKMAEIENRLKPIEKSKKLDGSIGSDTGASTRESESSEERFALENSRISSLYDSVAAELRAKLGKKNSPILLPPRDYDTVHRQKGNLTGIELRRCLNANIVGQNVKNKRLESSGGSSGIGSDHPPSPDSPETPESRFHTLETHSTSDDEDWNGEPGDSALYLMHGSHQVPLRANKTPDSSLENTREKPYREKSAKYTHEDLKFSKSFDDDYRKSLSHNVTKYLEKPIAKFSDNKYLQRQKSMVRDKEEEKEVSKNNFRKSLERELINRSANKYLEKSLSKSEKHHERDEDRKQYFYEDRSYEPPERRVSKPAQYFEDDGFDEENVRSRNNSSDFDKDRPSRSFSYEEEVFYEEKRPLKTQSRQRVNDEADLRAKDKFNPNDPRFYEPRSPPRPQRDTEEFTFDTKRYYYEDATNSINRRQSQFRQRSPTPDEVKAPRDRFKDAKEKFLLMEKERLEQERRNPEPPISPTIQRDKIHFIKRHQSMAYPSKDHLRTKYEERFSNERNDFSEEVRPKPAPRYNHEEVRYRQKERDGFRSSNKYEPKRRSMFSLIEEEHKKNSNEIAKELKRRSYVDFNDPSYQDEVTDFTRPDDRDIRNSRHYQELPEADRYNAIISQPETKYDPKFTKNPQKSFKSVPGYRHSYAEPKIKIDPKKKNMPDMLQRTNSSVGYLQQRVGIASMHPY
ncbi:uncharacterized protein LOC126733652 [Anthonomus grandis grandis]|uniref:uncharacterized protein LOC126733652 n=1 Tax=Anthonomus grandis grandis TaxID=2921223 RepID=UPI002165D4F7|nr:uncharacterized protein LOC126733652 [Anthonomus grandis grandis]